MADIETDLAPATPDRTGVVLIPVKAFDDAKARLSGTLDSSDRSTLAREMAAHLVRAQHDVPVAICCDDADVARWATEHGAFVIWCPEPGLNPSVQHGFGVARSAGYRHIAVAHSDLPLASSLAHLLGWSGTTLVPDRHRTGSNVLCVPGDVDFRFSYGVNSYQRHVIEAIRHRRGLRIVHDDRLAWDVDHPGDLDLPAPSFLHDLIESETHS